MTNVPLRWNRGFQVNCLQNRIGHKDCLSGSPPDRVGGSRLK